MILLIAVFWPLFAWMFRGSASAAPAAGRVSAATKAAVVAACACFALGLAWLVQDSGPGWQLARREVVAIWLDAASKFPLYFGLLWSLFAWLERRKP